MGMGGGSELPGILILGLASSDTGVRDARARTPPRDRSQR